MIDFTLTQSAPTASKQPVPEPKRSERTNKDIPPYRVAYTEPVTEPKRWKETLESKNPQER